jgi:DNA-binding PadR family transcriptional regulator
MIEGELILLGLLKEGPKHGYEIKKHIKKIFSLLAGVELKSIYYPLGVLEKNGLVIKRANKEGKRPERFVYALTLQGEKRFIELLNKSFLDFKRPRFSLDLSLYFLPFIDSEVAKRRLRARMIVLEGIIRGLRQMIRAVSKEEPLSLVRILEHNLQMVETESKFLSSLIKDL